MELNMATQPENNGAAPQLKNRRPWGILFLGAALLLVAGVIFSSAGPDRSRTPELKDTSPYALNPRNAVTEKTIPNLDMPTAPRSR
jgi:hypothetical protein